MNACASQLPRPERNRLVSEHVEVARRISLKMARRCPDWIPREDLMGAALVGLVEAADRYDTSRKEPFLAFAEKRIRGAVLDELRRGDIMPRRARAMARKIGETIRDLEKRAGGAVTDEAVAGALGVSVEDYRDNLEQLVHVTVGAFDDVHEATLSGGDESPELRAIRHEAMARIREVLPTLDRRDLVVLGLHYNEELTYTEIGQVLGVTTSRVCQLHGRAIACLRAALTGARASAPVRLNASRTRPSR